MTNKNLQIVKVSDIIEENGKTIRENNLAKKHKIPLYSLVEINVEDGNEDNGVRLFVVNHSRDCDGMPLYNLGMLSDKDRESLDSYGPHCFPHKWFNGFSKNCLKVIKLPNK